MLGVFTTVAATFVGAAASDCQHHLITVRCLTWLRDRLATPAPPLTIKPTCFFCGDSHLTHRCPRE